MEALITTNYALKRFVKPRHACLGALRGFQPLPVLERQLVLDSSDILHQHRSGSRCDAAPHVVQTFSEALQSQRAALISLSVRRSWLMASREVRTLEVPRRKPRANRARPIRSSWRR